MSVEVAALYIATFSVAFFHTMSPDHWVPFVMVGRSQKWPILKTELVALAAGTGHVGTSVIIALVGIFIGAGISEGFASIAEVVTGAALILFGFGYAFYMWRKGGHVHFTIGGDRFTDGHSHDQLNGSATHSHDHDQAHENGYERTHNHGDNVVNDLESSQAHSHTHQNQTRSPYALVVIMGLAPCIGLLPLAFLATNHGAGVTLGVIVLFCVATIIPILILTYLGSKGMQLIRFEWFERYGDIITGVVIGCIGLMTMFLGL